MCQTAESAGGRHGRGERAGAGGDGRAVAADEAIGQQAATPGWEIPDAASNRSTTHAGSALYTPHSPPQGHGGDAPRDASEHVWSGKVSRCFPGPFPSPVRLWRAEGQGAFRRHGLGRSHTSHTAPLWPLLNRHTWIRQRGPRWSSWASAPASSSPAGTWRAPSSAGRSMLRSTAPRRQQRPPQVGMAHAFVMHAAWELGRDD